MRTAPFFAILLIGVLALSACGDVGEAPEAEIGEATPGIAPGAGVVYAVDTTLSSIRWRGAKVTRAHEGGFDLFSGTVYVNRGKVNGILLNIQMLSIYSDILFDITAVRQGVGAAGASGPSVE